MREDYCVTEDRPGSWINADSSHKCPSLFSLVGFLCGITTLSHSQTYSFCDINMSKIGIKMENDQNQPQFQLEHPLKSDIRLGKSEEPRQPLVSNQINCTESIICGHVATLYVQNTAECVVNIVKMVFPILLYWNLRKGLNRKQLDLFRCLMKTFRL